MSDLAKSKQRQKAVYILNEIRYTTVFQVWNASILKPKIVTFHGIRTIIIDGLCSISNMTNCVPVAGIKAGTINYIPQIVWDIITCTWAWYLPLTQTSSYNLFTFLLCFIVLWLYDQMLMGVCDLFDQSLLFRVVSLAVGQYYDWLSGSETSLKDFVRIYRYQSTTNLNANRVFIRWGIL